MSIWADIQDRASGEVTRKEDQVQDNVWDINVKPNPIVYVGGFTKNSCGHTAGKLYYMSDDIEIDGKQFYMGDFVIDTGSSWEKIDGMLDNYYIGQ